MLALCQAVYLHKTPTLHCHGRKGREESRVVQFLGSRSRQLPTQCSQSSLPGLPLPSLSPLSHFSLSQDFAFSFLPLELTLTLLPADLATHLCPPSHLCLPALSSLFPLPVSTCLWPLSPFLLPLSDSHLLPCHHHSTQTV